MHGVSEIQKRSRAWHYVDDTDNDVDKSVAHRPRLPSGILSPAGCNLLPVPVGSLERIPNWCNTAQSDNASLKYDKVQLNANLKKIPHWYRMWYEALDAASFIRYRYANNPRSVYPGKLFSPNDRLENLFIVRLIQYLDLFKIFFFVISC